MDTERARRFLFWVGVGMGLALVILAITSQVAGCQQADELVGDVNEWASAGRQVLESPAGQSLPPDWRLYGGLATTLVMGGAAAYKQWRFSQMSKTTKAIVRGVEAAERRSYYADGLPRPPETSSAVGNPENPRQVKAAIAVEMRKLGVYDAGNKIVDRLKVS